MMKIYFFKVKGVDEVGHVVSSPVRQLFCVNIVISPDSKIFLCEL
jgi:hypothetical protein